MLDKLKAALEHSSFDAILITSEQNRRYATGFQSSAGACFITKQKGYFFTDFRYIEAAKSKIEGYDVTEVHGGEAYSKYINEIIRLDGVNNVGFEDNSLTFSEVNRWEKSLSAKLHPMGDLISNLRQVKTKNELECVISAQRIAEKALEEVLNDIKPGITEKEIAAKLIYLMLINGAEKMSFEPIVVSGKNSSMPHGVPSAKKIEKGDFVTMDFGCIFNGYCSDMTRTVAVGYVTEEMERIYNLVLKAQNAGISAAKAGVSGKTVDLAARNVIQEAGYGEYFGHGFGHGIGIDIHEMPNAGPNSQNVLQDGCIISAEPGIYLPEKFGVRIEDMLYITSEGCINLTIAPKKLIILN